MTGSNSSFISNSDDAQNHEYELQRNNHYSSNVIVSEYTEPTVTVVDWGKSVFNDPVGKTQHYFLELFPIFKWILHYNYKWAYSDLIAGVTVGVVLVPQSMSYAQLATLSPEYGLYSSFVGVFIYSFFATSKDVSIGPVAVMSMQVGRVIANVQEKTGDKFSGPEIATYLALICGGIAAAIGVLRLGFILEFISIPAVMGFMTGSAFSIVTGQVAGLMGYNNLIDSRQPTYLVVIDTLKNLKHTKIDAAFGLVCLFILYVWKFGSEFGQKRWPRYKTWFFYFQQLRNAIVIIFATLISWSIIHPELKAFDGSKEDFKGSLTVLGQVPSGFRHVGVFHPPNGIMKHIGSEIPVSTIILLLEHIAIAKSFGRVNDYKIVPDQELIAIGVNNLIGTFFNAYPATGSFSRSALKSKCGVKTPLAGIFTGAVVILALYALTEAFYYIPKATLSAIIIHAVSDLIASYKVTWNFWKVSPLDAGIFIVAVFITIFSSIENGIYFAIAASAAVLLFRVAIPKGEFLGRIKVAEVINPTIEDDDMKSINKEDKESSNNESSQSTADIEIHQVLSNNSNSDEGAQKSKLGKETSTTKSLLKKNPEIIFHTRWVPLNKRTLNSDLNVEPAPPGIVVFKPIESFTYPNCSLQCDRIIDEVHRTTRRGKPYSTTDKMSRPWNDPGPLNWNLPFMKKLNNIEDQEDHRPILRILHLDFSSVASTDITGTQALVDLRKALNNYAGREVEIHFSGILSPWIRRALLNSGFGTYGEEGLISNTNYVNIATKNDLELGLVDNTYHAAVPTNTPFFHLDIPNYQ